jgi:hypothetical protein
MSHVFISYKREDLGRVAPLVQALREGGIDTWWDQDIPPGGAWRDTIVEKLDSAALCIAVWSETSTGPAGRFVREEAERSARRAAYLGLLIDPVPPPFGFSEWQAVDLSDWDGNAGDPRLSHFVETVRAQLNGAPPPVAEPRAAKPQPARAKPRLPLVAGSLALAAAAGAALIWWAPWRSAAPPPATPTAFVSDRLAQADCTWASIGEVSALSGGEHISLKGIAAAPESIQAGLLRDAAAASVPLGGIDVRSLRAAPPEVCAELSMLKPFRVPANEHRLTIVPPREGPRRAGNALEGWFEWEIDWSGLPQHAALLGLDSQGGVEVLIPDLHAYRRQTRPARQEGEVSAYHAGFTDEGTGVRNVALILMTASAPIDTELVDRIGEEATSAFVQRVDEAAKGGGWKFELGLVECGFENGENRRC